MKQESSRIKSDILMRVRMLYVLFFLAGLLVFLRLLWVQFGSGEVAQNADRLMDRIIITKKVPAQRGSILARGGEPLATSIFRYEISIDFATETFRYDEARFYEEADSLAKLLAAHFRDRSAGEYAQLFRREYQRERDTYTLENTRDTTYFRSEGFFERFVDWICGEAKITTQVHDTIRPHKMVKIFPRAVDFAEWEQLRKYPLLNWSMGLCYYEHKYDERVYPQGELARRTIGQQGDRGRNYGIEYSFMEELASQDGKVTQQRIAPGFYARIPGPDDDEPVDGSDVVTTLDLELQDVADKCLRRQLEWQNASWGTTLVMDTHTGELLAMVNLGRNKQGEYVELENYALSRTMEPGSTYKLASMLVLLEEAKMSPRQTYNSNNGEFVNIGPAKKIKDDHKGDFQIDLRRAVAGSSNVYFAQAIWDHYGITGRKMDYSNFLRERLYQGKTVGLERFGERTPQVTSDWKVPDPGVMLVKMAYGYRVLLAPIHVLTLYNAVANDGKMISPILVKEIRREGEVVERFQSKTLVESIASKETLRVVRECLEAVASEGTASFFFRDTSYLRVAAKTGTAQVTSPGTVLGSRYLGTLVAFFPAEAPRYTVLTTVEISKYAGSTIYGTGLAGPVVEQVINYLHNRESESLHRTGQGADRYPEQMKGGDIAQLREVAGTLSPKVGYDRKKGWGTGRVDSLSTLHISAVDLQRGVMPDVRGMGLKDALFLLESGGLRVSAEGAGAVVKQSIPAGAKIKAGSAVTIILR